MSQATRRNAAPISSTTRAKVSRDRMSNGRLFQSTDLRSAGARRFRVLFNNYTAEIGGSPSETELALVRQVVSLQMESERLQELIARGESVDGDLLIRMNSEARRALVEIRSRAFQKRTSGDDQAFTQFLSNKYGETPDE